MVGRKGYFADRLADIIVKKKIHNVTFGDYIPDDKLSILYRHCLATVIPSLVEGFGLPPLEAMGNESLVVSSNAPILREVCDDAVIYCDPYDIHDIKRALQVVVHMPAGEREIYIRKAKKQSTFFSWDKMAKKTIAIYTQVLADYEK